MNKSEIIRKYIAENRKNMKRSELCENVAKKFNIVLDGARAYVREYENALEEEKRELMIIGEVDKAMRNKEKKLEAIKRLNAKYNVPIKKLDYIWLDLRLKQYYSKTIL